jgi:hypothetical protein
MPLARRFQRRRQSKSVGAVDDPPRKKKGEAERGKGMRTVHG